MEKKISIYIDGNNLYRSAKGLGFRIDYKKLGVWLRQKYKPEYIYIFIGFLSIYDGWYTKLLSYGFLLVFKQTVLTGTVIKGNCDAELVLKAVSDFYQNKCNACILISGDGDFGCLVQFLKDHQAFERILAPDRNKCSILLLNKCVKVTFLNELYPCFAIAAEVLNEKAPGADSSAQGSFSS